MSLRAALRLQCLVERRKTRRTNERALSEYWEAVELNEAKALQRNRLCSRRLGCLCEMAHPHLSERAVSPVSTDLATDGALLAGPPC